MSLKREAVQLAAKSPQSSFGFVSPKELSAIAVGRPHSPHAIRADAAARLLDVVAERLRTGQELG
ncbi:hypothetical protein [Variovorax atrisoli]|uniref:hypothetical protein n=1 Tax=Variovorax atrisoli TaxID=3394203 RepID=UPI0012FD4F21|nr:hypothetical protein [Variovorax paradoxus]